MYVFDQVKVPIIVNLAKGKKRNKKIYFRDISGQSWVITFKNAENVYILCFIFENELKLDS